MTFREIEKIIQKDGWTLSRVHGSHYHYRHSTKPGIVTIPRHGGDINLKVIKSIYRQAGL